MDQNEKEKSPTEILEYVISDVGLWTWCTDDLPSIYQIEFNRVMLYLVNMDKNQPPSHQIALRFINPVSISYLYKKNSSLPQDWLQRFKNDKLSPFNVDHDYLSFDKDEVMEIVKMSNKIENIYGIDFNSSEFMDSKVIFSFWAGEIGCLVAADDMKVISKDGEIKLDSIPELHDKWWIYWKSYWKVHETNKALPYDDLCEITIPVG